MVSAASASFCGRLEGRGCSDCLLSKAKTTTGLDLRSLAEGRICCGAVTSCGDWMRTVAVVCSEGEVQQCFSIQGGKQQSLAFISARVAGFAARDCTSTGK